MAADADVALAQLGAGAWVCGAGLGAYVALLLAGARPDAVAGAILWPGAGLEGGGSEPDFGAPERPREGRHPAPRGDADPEVQATPSTDPRVMHGLAADIRPLDYVESFALDARRLVLVEGPGRVPPWWERVRTVAGVTLVAGDQATPAAVLALAAGAPGEPGSLR
jgi:pimeloyl-ACP methyl ester carboxylesterase